jgi:hypothetical protein
MGLLQTGQMIACVLIHVAQDGLGQMRHFFSLEKFGFMAFCRKDLRGREELGQGKATLRRQEE